MGTYQGKDEFMQSGRSKNDTSIYYASNLSVIEQIPMEVRGRANMAIIEYGAGREISHPIIEIDKKEVDLRVFFRHIFDGIDAEKRRYSNKMKINEKQDELARMNGSMNAHEVELSIKALRKLALEANRHDIKNIDERIKEVLPNGYIEAKREEVPFDEKFEIITNYFSDIGKNNYLTVQEHETFKKLLAKAEKNRQEANKPRHWHARQGDVQQ